MLTATMGRITAALGRLPSMIGPLFNKELLVTSRRPRYYILRFGYAAMLGLFISLVWLALIQPAAHMSAAYRTTKMAEMGKGIVLYIVCFQFGVAQLVAAVLLSAAISEEIYQRTLLPILTTPIAYWQIVVGKFLGKLIHVLLLLAISLPLMAVVRVLGGVPWGFLLSGVCLTVTASALIGSVSMFFSIVCRRAYLSLLATLGVVIAVYAMLGGMTSIAAGILSAVLGTNLWAIVLYPNPVAALIYECVVLTDPSVSVPGFYWPLHCLLVLLMTAGVLKLCEIMVRRSAIRKAIGMQAGPVVAVAQPVWVQPAPAAVPTALAVLMPADEAPPAGPPPAAPAQGQVPPPQPLYALPAYAHPRYVQPGYVQPAYPQRPPKRRWRPKGWNLKEVIGSPIFWRELRKPLLRDKIVQIVVMCAVLFYLLYVYAIFAASGSLVRGGAQAGFVVMFLGVGMLCAAVDSATSIAPEKQARTWPALLSTPVSDWHILLGKAGGTLFRCLAVWIFLAAHMLLFTLAGILHPIAILHVTLLVVWASVFLTGVGLYFSTRCRRATTAVLGTVGVALLLWVLFPAMLGFLGEAFGGGTVQRLAGDYLLFNPAVQATTVTDGACGYSSLPDVASLDYHWPGDSTGALEATLVMLVSTFVYCGAGLLLAWRAKRRFRKHVFES